MPQRPRTGKPKIIENIQVAPPRRERVVNKEDHEKREKEEEKDQEDWQVVKRKDKKKGKVKGKDQRQGQERKDLRSQPASSDPTPRRREGNNNNRTGNQGPARRPPRTAAVTLTGVGEKFSYADALRKARENIDLKELKITNSKIRRAANGEFSLRSQALRGQRKQMIWQPN